MKTARDAIADTIVRYGNGDANATAILAALDAAGYAVVPKEPTEEMVDAFWPAREQYELWARNAKFPRPMLPVHLWQHMLAAAGAGAARR